MILQLHLYRDLALPYIAEMDAACVAADYSQHKLFVQICAESAWNQNAKSPTGAEGLCQIEPDTASDWACNPNDPVSAMTAMAKNMAMYEEQFAEYDGGGFDCALAAYNAGEGSVEHYRGVPPYAETQEYVRTITDTVNNSANAWPAFYAEMLAAHQATNPPETLIHDPAQHTLPTFHAGE